MTSDEAATAGPRPPEKLTLADAYLLNLAAAAYVEPAQAPERRDFLLGEIERILPRVTRDGLRMADLARACDAMVRSWPRIRDGDPDPEAPTQWCKTRFDLGVALAALFLWRAAEAQRHLFPELAERA